MHPPFLIGEALRFGWERTRAHSGIVFKVLLTLFGLQIAQSIVTQVLMPSFEGVLALAVIIIAGIVVGAGALVITLKLARGETAHYNDIIPPLELVARYFFASMLAGIVILIGFVLLIVPGIYFLARYSMVRFAAIDGHGIVGSLRESGKLTEGVKWRLLGFMFVLVLLNLLGVIAFVVGLLITVPVSMIAHAHVYQKLKSRS